MRIERCDLSRYKKKTEEFLRLIKKASKSITRGINVASALQKKRGIVKRLISERKADFNVDLKRKTLLKQDFNIRGSNDVNYLKYLLKIFETSTNDINEQLLREESNRESRKVIKKGKMMITCFLLQVTTPITP